MPTAPIADPSPDLAPAQLPADGHVHSQFSYDTNTGDMVATCARAVELGLPVVAFTEHSDLTPFTFYAHEREHLYEPLRSLVPEGGGVVQAPPLDVQGYLASIERCRDQFPQLRILTGVELGEPHRFPTECAELVKAGGFERVLGSLHSLEARGGFAEVSALVHEDDPLGVVRTYLAELAELAGSTADFDVLAHVDFPVRYLPERAKPFSFEAAEPEYRAVLEALARSGRALEVNTRLPLPSMIVRWWHEAGGQAVTFGSDAHAPWRLGNGFREAMAMVEAAGFRPAREAQDPWQRG